jgi:hypothetical protein
MPFHVVNGLDIQKKDSKPTIMLVFFVTFSSVLCHLVDMLVLCIQNTMLHGFN